MLDIVIIEKNQLMRNGLEMCLNDHPLITVSCLSDKWTQFICQGGASTQIVLFDHYNSKDIPIIHQLKTKNPGLKLVLMSSKDQLLENFIFCKNESLSGLISKEHSLEQLIALLLKVAESLEGEMVIPEDLEKRLNQTLQERTSFFTERERQILSYIGMGKTNKKMAELLNISIRTIETHRRRMIEKLGCNNIIPVILYALEKQYIKLEISHARASRN
jgi:DNA-binding NarL/FixJ family response regulator